MIFFSIFWIAYVPLAMLLITLVIALTTDPRGMRAASRRDTSTGEWAQRTIP
jgi:hypothetical protein